MNKVLINQSVSTPLGTGVAQNTAQADETAQDVVLCFVRLPIDETTSKHLGDPNCLTPRPAKSALFFFPLCDVSPS